MTAGPLGSPADPAASAASRRRGLLTVDCGNSTLDLMLHGPVPQRQRLQRGDCGGLRAFLAAWPVARAVLATVVPDGLAALLAEFAAARVPCACAGRDLPCPLPLDYETPATLGADRWLAALAAWRRFGRAIVVDCGSATTVNLVDQDGTFRGGAIGPGFRALQAGMAAVTPALPPVAPGAAGAEVPMPPKSSRAAVHAGAVLGYCGLVERLVADTLRAAGGPCTVVLTGGNASLYLQHGRLRPCRADDLVHEGLALLEEGVCAS
jgi:type III pantothenate kinase